MGAKVFSFHRAKSDFDKYETYLHELKLDVAECSRFCRQHMVKLAMMKAWKKWDEEQPLGARMHFTDDMFLECEDENVGLLMSAINSMQGFAGEVMNEDVPEEQVESTDSLALENSHTDPDEVSCSVINREDSRPELNCPKALLYIEKEGAFWIACPAKVFPVLTADATPFDEGRILNLIAKYYNSSYEVDGRLGLGPFSDCIYFTYSRERRIRLTTGAYALPTLIDSSGVRPIEPILISHLQDLQEKQPIYLD
jgi:hypothetical protein